MTPDEGQLTLDLMQGRALRDRGMNLADQAQPGEWRTAVDIEITRRAALRTPFTSDDVSAVTGDSPTGSQGAMGARFANAARRGIIRRVGYIPSRRPAVHAHPVAQWIGGTFAAPDVHAFTNEAP